MHLIHLHPLLKGAPPPRSQHKLRNECSSHSFSGLSSCWLHEVDTFSYNMLTPLISHHQGLIVLLWAWTMSFKVTFAHIWSHPSCANFVFQSAGDIPLKIWPTWYCLQIYSEVLGKYAHNETHELKFKRKETEWGKCDERSHYTPYNM